MPVRDHLDDVAGEQRLAVMEHGAALEVAAEPEQRGAAPELLRLARPELDRRIRTHDPLAIGLVEQDRDAPPECESARDHSTIPE